MESNMLTNKACNLGPVGWAIMNRSVLYLQAAIEANPRGVYESVGYANVLQLSLFLDWHEGLCILLGTLGKTTEGLDHIHDYGLSFVLHLISDTHWRLVVRQLSYRDCDLAKSARFILETGCQVPDYTAEYIVVPCIRDLIIEHLQSRREQLKALALNHLTWTQAEYAQLHEPNHCLDTRATEIIQQLEALNIQVPRIFYPTTRFEWRDANDLGVWQANADACYLKLSPDPAAAWEALYNAGFTEIDGYYCSESSTTPLGKVMRYAPFCLWLLDKGSNLSATYSKKLSGSLSQPAFINTGTVAHQIARFYSGRLTELFSCHTKWDLVEISLIQRALLAQIPPDCCSCACSLEGCTPLVCLFSRAYRLHKFDSKPQVWRELRAILRWLGPCLQHPAKTAAEAFIRALCFNMLELRHTCCAALSEWDETRWQTEKDFREEMEMLQDEDEELLQEFEDLVHELVQRFHQSGRSISQFILTTFRRRVRQVKKEWKSHSPDASRCQDIGVRMMGPNHVKPAPQRANKRATQYDPKRPGDRQLWLEKHLDRIFDGKWPLGSLSNQLVMDFGVTGSY